MLVTSDPNPTLALALANPTAARVHLFRHRGRRGAAPRHDLTPAELRPPAHLARHLRDLAELSCQQCCHSSRLIESPCCPRSVAWTAPWSAQQPPPPAGLVRAHSSRLPGRGTPRYLPAHTPLYATHRPRLPRHTYGYRRHAHMIHTFAGDGSADEPAHALSSRLVAVWHGRVTRDAASHPDRPAGAPHSEWRRSSNCRRRLHVT